MITTDDNWQLFPPRLSVFQTLPLPLYMRAKQLPERSKIIAHRHNWDQLIFASSGLLTVECHDGEYLIPHQQAIWIPANIQHSIASTCGAQLRSVHLQQGIVNSDFKHKVAALIVDPLSQLLIEKVSRYFATQNTPADVPHLSAQQQRLIQVLIDQISQFGSSVLSLPMSDDPLLRPILQHLQQYPDNRMTLTQWGAKLGASGKTIARRFEAKLGVSFSRWREQLVLHRAIQALSEQRSITEIALSLGYDSLPAFIAMFKRHMALTPGQFQRLHQKIT